MHTDRMLLVIAVIASGPKFYRNKNFYLQVSESYHFQMEILLLPSNKYKQHFLWERSKRKISGHILIYGIFLQ